MNKKNILTYGLTGQQNYILQQNFGKESVIDVTECFLDLIAIPAAVVVVNPTMMDEKEQEIFNEVFQEDFDTRIVCIDKVQNMKFLYTKEENIISMKNTIETIKERFSVSEEYINAKKHVDEIVRKIKEIIEPDSSISYESQVVHMENYSIPYNNLNKLLQHILNLMPKDKYLYRGELILILKSVMLSYGIIEESELEFDCEDSELDRCFVRRVSDAVNEHIRNMGNR